MVIGLTSLVLAMRVPKPKSCTVAAVRARHQIVVPRTGWGMQRITKQRTMAKVKGQWWPGVFRAPGLLQNKLNIIAESYTCLHVYFELMKIGRLWSRKQKKALINVTH